MEMSYSSFVNTASLLNGIIYYLQVIVFAPTNIIISSIPMLIDLKELDVITPARPIRKVRGSVFPLFISILAANGGKAGIKQSFTGPCKNWQRNENLYTQSLLCTHKTAS